MTLTLYYIPGYCSLSPHIILKETGLDYKLVKVDQSTGKLESGEDWSQLNPKGYVPALKLANGRILTEGTAVTQYLVDQKPEKHLLGEGEARYFAISWLAYLNSEVHPAYGLLFNPKITAEAKQAAVEKLNKYNTLLDKQIEGKQYLTGETFTAADSYLFVLSSWAALLKYDLSPFKHIQEWQKRVEQRPSVQAALKEEGLA